MFRRMSALLTGLGLVLLTPAPAFATEFAGPHVEAVIGWNRNDGGVGSRDGFAYGGGGGYDLRFGRVVAGVLGEVGDVTGRDCRLYDFPAGPGYLGYRGRGCREQGSTIFAGARVGYVIGDRSLVFVTGGYANMRFSNRFAGTIDGAPARFHGHSNEDGIRAGAGIEQAIARHVFVKAEYRYTAVGHELGIDQHQVVTGIGYRF